MRHPAFSFLAASLALALCGCNGDDNPPPLKKTEPASKPVAPATPPPAPMTTKPAPKPTPVPPPATTPTKTAQAPTTTEPIKTTPMPGQTTPTQTPPTPPTTPATTEPLGTPTTPVTPITPVTPATTEPLGGQPATPATTEPIGKAEPDPVPGAPPRVAIARLSPTAGNQVSGTVTFTSTGTGVKVQVSLTGLTPGEHGLHIHEKGDCSAPDAASAGEHFSTKPEPHAGPQDAARHTGDLGNVTADEQGRVETTFTDERISLIGEDSILRRSVIVHADRDDLTSQPVGNSGARVACGVIEPQS